MACQALRAKATSMAIQDKSSPPVCKAGTDRYREWSFFLRDNRDKGETYAQLLTRNGLADMAATGDAQYGEGYSSEVGHPESREPQQGGGGDRTKYSMHALERTSVRFAWTKRGQVRVSRWVYTLVDASLTLRLHAANHRWCGVWDGYVRYTSDAHGCALRSLRQRESRRVPRSGQRRSPT